MNDKLKAVKITITYYGAGKTLASAKADAWNTISNDDNFSSGDVNETECDFYDTGFDEDWYNNQ